MTGFDAKTAALVVARDLGACVRCGRHVAHLERGREWAIHHRRPRGTGGTSLDWVNRAANGVVLCENCHGWVESNRDVARSAGFLVPLNGTLRADEVPIQHFTLGDVLLTDAGGWTHPNEGPTPESLWEGLL